MSAAEEQEASVRIVDPQDADQIAQLRMTQAVQVSLHAFVGRYGEKPEVTLRAVAGAFFGFALATRQEDLAAAIVKGLLPSFERADELRAAAELYNAESGGSA